MIGDGEEMRLLRKLAKPEIGLGLRLTASGGQGDLVLPAYIGQIWTRSYFPNKTRSGATSYTSITRHVVCESPATQQIILPGYYYDDNLDLQLTGAYSSSFTIEQPLNTIIGTGSASLAGDGMDSAPATISYTTLPAVGSQVILRQTITTANNLTLIPFTSNGGGDQLWTNESPSPLYPINVVGTTTKPTFAIGINSRGTANGSPPDAGGNTGELARSIGARGYAWCMIGTQSESINGLVRNRRPRLRIAQYASHVFLNGSRPGSASTAANEAAITLANLRNSFQIFWDKAIGVCTTPPKPSDYTTPDPLNASRLIFNSAVRALGSPVRSVADIAHVEGFDPTDSGLWDNASYLNTDYTHETDAGYQMIVSAGAVDVGGFARASAAAQSWSCWRLSQMTVQDFGSWATPNDLACLNGNSFLTCKNNVGAFRQTNAPQQPAIVSVLSGTATGMQFNIAAATELTSSTTPRDCFASNNVPVDGGLMACLIIPGATVGTTKGLLYTSTGSDATASRFALSLATGNIPRLTLRRKDADSAIVRSCTEALIAGTPYLLVAYAKITSTSSLAIRINGTFGTNATEGGVFPLSGLSGTNGNWDNTRATTCAVGSANGTAYSNDTIVEFLQLPSAPSLSDVQKLEGEWMWRYGLQNLLPSGHPFRLSPPSN